MIMALYKRLIESVVKLRPRLHGSGQIFARTKLARFQAGPKLAVQIFVQFRRFLAKICPDPCKGDFCNTGALLFQLSCQANKGLIVNMSIKEHIYISTAKKDVMTCIDV